MVNLCLVSGEVASEPELRFGEDQPDSASFKMFITLENKHFGWIQVFCLDQEAETAAKQVHKGTKVAVIGPLVRGFLKVGEDIWWGEVIVSARILEVIE